MSTWQRRPIHPREETASNQRTMVSFVATNLH
jgi:hypothetical protein